MIAVDSLTRRYGDFVAVDDISFEIEKGEIVGLLGHNGAGKTTIMKMLTGFLEPSGGGITVDGLDMETHRSAIQRRIGYLPENCPLYPEMTVSGYLEYAALLHGVPESERGERIREAVARTELGLKALDRIGILSRGYQQRVGVAQAILHSPEIIVLDEPTNGLDPGQIFHMRALIKELAESATVIVSTHILQEVQATCDRVIIIYHGKTYLDARLEDLRRVNRLLVATDAGPEQAGSIFDRVDGVTGFDVLPGEREGHFRYAISLSGDGQAAAVAPAVAKAVIDHDSRLFSLSQESRDIETIFAEISVHDGRAIQ